MEGPADTPSFPSAKSRGEKLPHRLSKRSLSAGHALPAVSHFREIQRLAPFDKVLDISQRSEPCIPPVDVAEAGKKPKSMQALLDWMTKQFSKQQTHIQMLASACAPWAELVDFALLNGPEALSLAFMAKANERFAADADQSKKLTHAVNVLEKRCDMLAETQEVLQRSISSPDKQDTVTPQKVNEVEVVSWEKARGDPEEFVQRKQFFEAQKEIGALGDSVQTLKQGMEKMALEKEEHEEKSKILYRDVNRLSNQLRKLQEELATQLQAVRVLEDTDISFRLDELETAQSRVHSIDATTLSETQEAITRLEAIVADLREGGSRNPKADVAPQEDAQEPPAALRRVLSHIEQAFCIVDKRVHMLILLYRSAILDEQPIFSAGSCTTEAQKAKQRCVGCGRPYDLQSQRRLVIEMQKLPKRPTIGFGETTPPTSPCHGSSSPSCRGAPSPRR